MTEKVKKKSKDKLIGLYILLIAIILIWISSLIVIPRYLPNLTDRALLGDSFGTINSLFSGLAFAGIIYTILLQRTELSLQREELTETKLELRRSADAQEKSEKQQRRQSENLKITAKLNALNTLLNYYSNELPTISTNDRNRRKVNLNLQEKYISQIKEILDRKENRATSN